MLSGSSPTLNRPISLLVRVEITVTVSAPGLTDQTYLPLAEIEIGLEYVGPE